MWSCGGESTDCGDHTRHSDALAQVHYLEAFPGQDGQLRFEKEDVVGIPCALTFNDPSISVNGFTTLPPSHRRPTVTADIMVIFSQRIVSKLFHTLLSNTSRLSISLKVRSVHDQLYVASTYYTNAPTPRFFNTKNFPLDESRYTTLATSFPSCSLPSATRVARGMGEMLSHSHFKVSVDARDVELSWEEMVEGVLLFLHQL
ncbi:hypothetical protein Moror_13507 [Moniliophthora roreri MCA 2997]|uniref:Uncharacterized protein n=1 Tax=Moniliophthora roreri (strain MCA 2997) TaxID=1381753 RepID=V2WUH0_MONRO|nr:hypothetical protein Moror_13507 [Moniliophthora roreri MCA 2997]